MLFDTNHFSGFGVADSCPSCGDFGPCLHCCLHLPSFVLPAGLWSPLHLYQRHRGAVCEATTPAGVRLPSSSAAPRSITCVL